MQYKIWDAGNTFSKADICVKLLSMTKTLIGPTRYLKFLKKSMKANLHLFYIIEKARTWLFPFSSSQIITSSGFP